MSQRAARDGSFHFSSLPVGEYNLHVVAPGFAAFDDLGIRIDVGRRIKIPILLQIAKSASVSPEFRNRMKRRVIFQ